MVLTPPLFSSHTLGTLFPPLLCFFLHPNPPPLPSPPSPPPPPPPPPPRTTALPFLSPSPIPLSQLPVELAAVQDLADGSVIRSASLCSLFSSPLFFLSFLSLFNQITEKNFSPFGFEFFSRQFDTRF